MFMKRILPRLRSSVFSWYKDKIKAGDILYNKHEENINTVFMYLGGSVMPPLDSFYQGL